VITCSGGMGKCGVGECAECRAFNEVNNSDNLEVGVRKIEGLLMGCGD